MAEQRATLIDGFLAKAGWAGAGRTSLAGDASARRYLRLERGGDHAVLMDADPALGENVSRFVQVGEWLAEQGYSAPRLLAADAESGFLLLEDLGDDLIARLVAANPDRELALYQSVTAFLTDLHQRPPPDFLAVAAGAALGDLAARIADWYLPALDAPATDAARRIGAEIARLHDRLSDGRLAVSLRDFHAENLIWLPDRAGSARVGLLDFQDAFVTHPAYDLVSLCQDARCEVSEATEAACIDAYVRANGLEQARFEAIYALLGAQRALRIIAVFARLCLRSGKAHYVDYIPRVWTGLTRNLRHPELATLARLVGDGLPPPTTPALRRIKEKCGTRPDL